MSTGSRKDRESGCASLPERNGGDGGIEESGKEKTNPPLTTPPLLRERSNLAPRVGSGEIPGYLARYRERIAGDGSSANGSFYLRRFREGGSGEPRPSRRGDIEVHLIRHGQTQGYTVDGGLTPLGALQARRRGWEISKEADDGENIALVAAETKRALRTAEFILGGFEDGMASLGKSANVAGPEFADEFQNFLVRTPSGLKDPTVASREYEKEAGRERGGVPMWLDEVGRFWGIQKGGSDPIEYWLTFPLATFEPPGAVVRRYWAGIKKLIEENENTDRLVCAVHSGPMRAFATTVIGRDLGEPENTEEVRVKIKRDFPEAEVSYRGHTRKVEVPPFEEPGVGSRESGVGGKATPAPPPFEEHTGATARAETEESDAEKQAAKHPAGRPQKLTG